MDPIRANTYVFEHYVPIEDSINTIKLVRTYCKTKEELQLYAELKNLVQPLINSASSLKDRYYYVDNDGLEWEVEL
jgi:hypothetical protein